MIVRPSLGEKLRIVSNTYQMLGLWQTVKKVLVYLLQGKPKDTFDERYGVSTAAAVEIADAGIEDTEGRALAVKYVATPEPVMRHILKHSTAGLNLEEFSFIDLGCGKGRILIMAAQLPFREVVGVELSPAHCEIAQDNTQRFLAGGHPVACQDLRVVCANALEFHFPDNPILIYMYRPFLAAVVQQLADILLALQARTGHRILLAYSCPIEEYVLEKTPGFSRIAEYQTISVEQSWSLWECRAESSSTAQ